MQYWKKHLPTFVEKQQIEFQGARSTARRATVSFLYSFNSTVHDFFDNQPVQNASVFLLRRVVHNYPDARVVQILTRLRGAAMPNTQLVIIDRIVPVASSVDSEDPRVQGIPGATPPCASPPLLPNWGVASAGVYHYDMTVRLLPFPEVCSNALTSHCI